MAKPLSTKIIDKTKSALTLTQLDDIKDIGNKMSLLTGIINTLVEEIVPITFHGPHQQLPFAGCQVTN